MDLSKVHNPYDFANPVSDAELFVGRKEELEEIKYYLDHAKTAPRPINLAILGGRASGKTSLINMCEIEAKKLGFCTVRIDLDEGDAKTELGFFYKLFDGIFSACCRLGTFEGRKGKTYDAYREIVNAYMVPEDKTFCPFQFPLQYAKAMGCGNENAKVSDYSFKEDLETLSSEVGRPIIVIFDEGNVFANSRIHLEKLRNIFMNTPGYMLVMTGTPDLFPVMDEVFSPIVRQFKKINVGAFKNKEETRECIKKPLESIRVSIDNVFDPRTYTEVREIHDLSGGRPYEIHLICHKLFQRVQSKRAKMMRLNLSVLEDVRKELETSQDITTRPILARIRTLGKQRLEALGTLCVCDGYATLEQIWALSHLFYPESSFSRQQLRDELEQLVAGEILEIENNIIKFKGDDFDKIYTKYLARERGVTVPFPTMPLPMESLYEIELSHFIDRSEEVESIGSLFGSHADPDLGSIASALASTESRGDVFAESPRIVQDVYFCMVDNRDKNVVPIARAKLTLPWLTVQSPWFHGRKPEPDEKLRKCLERIDSLENRAKELGGEVAVDRLELPVAPIDQMVEKVEMTANDRLRKGLAHKHCTHACRKEYLDHSNLEEALFHADLSFQLNSVPSPEDSNDLGYIFLATDHLDSAKILLDIAVGYSEKHDMPGLPLYNMAILEAKLGNIEKALDIVGQAIEITRNLSEEKRKCACLLAPEVSGKELEFKEISKPDLLEVARMAESNLRTFLSEGSNH